LIKGFVHPHRMLTARYPTKVFSWIIYLFYFIFFYQFEKSFFPPIRIKIGTQISPIRINFCVHKTFEHRSEERCSKFLFLWWNFAIDQRSEFSRFCWYFLLSIGSINKGKGLTSLLLACSNLECLLGLN
jgi:hypothetical protein